MITKIGSEVGAYMNHKKKLYFGDDDVNIYDVIIEEPVWKWSHNYGHEISIDPFAELPVF